MRSSKLAPAPAPWKQPETGAMEHVPCRTREHAQALRSEGRLQEREHLQVGRVAKPAGGHNEALGSTAG